MMVEVVEFKSTNTVFCSFVATKCGRETFPIFFFFFVGFVMGLKYNHFLLYKINRFAYVTIGTYLPYEFSFESCFELATKIRNDQ